MIKKIKSTVIFIVACLSFSLGVFSQEEYTSGHQSGKLMVVGGGGIDQVFGRFMEEAGGKEVKLVVIPTASGRQDLDESNVRQNIIEYYSGLGALNVEVLHTYDPEVANSRDFVKPLLDADALWFSGGRQWRLMDAYDGTLALKEFWNILERGGIIGGTSAGATIQGSYLARGDTKSNLVMMGDHQEGFGFLSNMAIDQHVLVRNRQFDMFEILQAKPELLGIGLDEKTALLISGDTAEVVGPSYVLIYDGSMWQRDVGNPYPVEYGNKQFYFLRNGNRYDLRNRKVIMD